MPTKGRSCDVLNRISESFRPYVKEVIKELNFGLCKSKIEFEKLKSSCSRSSLCDQFTLILPYAGHFLKWEVIFDSSNPWLAPDFRFDDDSFLIDANSQYIESYVPSLANWDNNDPKSLSHIINELMILYREHQRNLLRQDENSRAYFEYSALIGESNTLENDIEVLVGRGDSVNFMIKLNLDCTPLPSLFADDSYENPGGEYGVLLVKYPNPTMAELIISPLVKRAVGDILLPQIHQTAVLMDYVPMVTSLINNKITQICNNKILRQELLSWLIVQYEGGVLEHDSNMAAFLFNVDDFYCILHVEIGVSFPEKPPALTLRSVYHSMKGKPRTKILASCPYDRIKEYISQQIKIFRQECTAITLSPNDNQNV